jgi:hypothetical protein
MSVESRVKHLESVHIFQLAWRFPFSPYFLIHLALSIQLVFSYPPGPLNSARIFQSAWHFAIPWHIPTRLALFNSAF